jgi:hypothetical protein
MKVFARVRPAHHHDDEIPIREHSLVTDRRLQQMPIFIDPSREIECLQRIHGYVPQT